MEKIKLDLTHLVNSYDSYKLKYGSLTMAVLDKYRDLSKSGGRQNSHNGTLPNGNDVKDEFKDKFIEDDHGQNIVKLKN